MPNLSAFKILHVELALDANFFCAFEILHFGLGLDTQVFRF